MASIGLEACFGFVPGHTHDVPGWYLGCIEDMHRCRPQAVVLYFWLRETFWIRTDIIVPANEKIDIMMLSNRANCANSGHSDLHSAFTLWLPFRHITVQ